ncbi:zinc finger protein [Abeliophyllum distichum]|uniref:Zinc finger protein n=1 Tax=Abeliophyllum distichum TaxID=126358 RepID=A0ABD1QGA8_9LAMI
MEGEVEVEGVQTSEEKQEVEAELEGQMTLHCQSNIKIDDQAWYADSGASHHVTTDKENVDEVKEYGWKKKMVVGNGTSLQIFHIGTKSFDVKSDKTLVLHVPKIKKNLISVSKLTTDNNVSVEFFPNGCVVNDLPTRKVMLQGKLENGLYQLNLPNHDSRHQNSSSTIHHQSNINHTLLNISLNKSVESTSNKSLESKAVV